MTEFLAVKVELFDLEWVDLTRDVLVNPPIEAAYGIRDNGPQDRTATTGMLKFTLRNDAWNSAGKAGYYTPGGVHCRAGFSYGAIVRLRLLYKDIYYPKFFGRISEIVPDLDAQTVAVTVLDWIDLAARHRLYLPSYTTSKNAGEVVALVVANMPIAPLAAETAAGAEAFDNVFDTNRANTTALAEIDKVIQSELGYAYIKYNPETESGETLKVEGRYTRANVSGPKVLEYSSTTSGKLLLMDGGDLLLEDGGKVILNGVTFEAYLNEYVYGEPDPIYIRTESADGLLMEDGGRVILNETIIAGVNNSVMDFKITYGRNVYNQVRYTTYPRYVDAAATTVLFALNSPIELGAGETKSGVLGRFRDPTGGAAKVSGRNMVTPAATTDYLMNSASDGSGTNLTASLTVTAVYGTEGVEYTLTNTSGTKGYITKLQARGRGVYIYDPVSLMVEDATSQAAMGTRTLDLDLKYQKNIETAKTFATTLLNQYMNPQLSIDGVMFNANRNEEMMLMFLMMEPGDCFHIAELRSGISQNMFINGVEYRIEGRAVFCTWIPNPAIYGLKGTWELGTAGKSELDSTTILGY